MKRARRAVRSSAPARRAAPRRPPSAGAAPREVFVFGAGKVGAALARALRRAGVAVTLRPARRGWPRGRIDADVVILAVRDGDIPRQAAELAARELVGHRRVAVLHCAGALGPEALAPVRSARVAVAQMHPMISIASPRWSPSLARGQLHVDGDAFAVRAARALGRTLGMAPRTIAGLDRVAYHAAAGLCANGAAALAAGGVELLARAGVPRATAVRMLGPLLRSVAENVEHLGMPAALTGPVRRGDAAGVKRHLETLRRLAPNLVAMYLAAARAQLPLARVLAEAPDASFAALSAALDEAARGSSSSSGFQQ